MSDQRKTPRISSRIPVQILERDGPKTTTINVSREGIFVEEGSERFVTNLMRVRITIPPENKIIEVFGKVAWSGTMRGTKGTGIKFHSLNSDDRKVWLDYVQRVEQLDTFDPLRSPGAVTGEAFQDKLDRPATSYMVRHNTMERLRQFIANDFHRGEMFLKTPVLKPLGEKVGVVLVHPESKAELSLEAEVCRVNQIAMADQPKGMTLKFAKLTPERQALLEEFVGMKIEPS